jgi:SAM-dependent methyltransferase
MLRFWEKIMPAPQTIWAPDDAERFVRELFEHVLRVNPVPEEQIVAWTSRATTSGDPRAIFRAMIEIPAHQAQLATDFDARTRWPSGHFYSPVPSRGEVQRDEQRIYAPRSMLAVDLRADKQIRTLERLAPFFATTPFQDESAPPLRYYYNNPSYGYGDAIVFWAMINVLRPRRIFEVGSGFSSALALDAIDSLDLETVCTFVDPFPEVVERATAPLRPPHRIFPQRIQEIDPEAIRLLEVDDILFIDSSHVLKAGSDVHFELTELLPRLQPGVIVHFHDAFNNFEYPKKWVLEQNHGWNELYALHLFLSYNAQFKIEYFNDYVAKQHGHEIERLAPELAPRILRNPGGGLWIRRV